MTDPRAAALRRILDGPDAEQALDLLSERLSTADLSTLLLEVMRRRSQAVSPASLLERYRNDAFVARAAPDGRDLVRLAHLLVEALPGDMEVIGLSPVAPLGASSALGPVHQDRVISTLRGSEVVSDATNVLALEAAVRRSELLRQHPRSGSQVRLAAVHRVLRGQRFPTGYQQHFSLLSVATAGRDGGSHEFEKRCLGTETRALVDVLLAVGVQDVEVRVTDLSDGRFDPVGSVDSVLSDRPGVTVVAAQDRERGRGYYRDACIELRIGTGEDQVELGDGGFVSWTADLLSNRKERLFTAAISIDRLA